MPILLISLVDIDVGLWKPLLHIMEQSTALVYWYVATVSWKAARVFPEGSEGLKRRWGKSWGDATGRKINLTCHFDTWRGNLGRCWYGGAVSGGRWLIRVWMKEFGRIWNRVVPRKKWKNCLTQKRALWGVGRVGLPGPDVCNGGPYLSHWHYDWILDDPRR